MLFFDVVLATSAVALLSIVGVLFFGSDKRLVGLERYVVPTAVGVFLALVLTELVPETLHEAPLFGPLTIGLSFILVYALAHRLHHYLHTRAHEHNEKREAALLILFGDAFHNFADGVVIAGGFFVSPEVGFITAAAIAVHELPQEIVEFGVLIRAGYTRTQAVLRNVLSASTVVLGGLFALGLAQVLADWLWVLTAFVAGNLLYVAASELLPRLHGSKQQYDSLAGILVAMLLGYGVTAGAIVWSHEYVLPAGVHDHGHEEDVVVDEHEDNGESELEDESAHNDLTEHHDPEHELSSEVPKAELGHEG